jgi:hypothetical protein
MVRASNIPAETRAADRWLVWRREPVHDTGRFTKIPYIATEPSQLASSTDSSTWRSFDDALVAFEDGKSDGVGFALGDGFVGVDIDKCVTDGTIDDDAQAIIAAIDSYTEFSPSGSGVHILMHGVLPQGRRRTGRYELYDSARYFTVTGNHVSGTPTTLTDATAALAQVHHQLFALPSKSPAMAPVMVETITDAPPEITDAQLLEKMFGASNGVAIRALWNGDIAGYPSRSEADLALANHLVWWCNHDAHRVDALFRRSQLYREKWDKPRGTDTYGGRTISTAMAACQGGYTGGDDVEVIVTPPHQVSAPAPCALAEVDAAFIYWLGPEYDLQALHAVLAVAAVEQLDGDPAWALVLSGPGNAKTETVTTLEGAGALVTSTIASEGALLSGSAKREQTKDSTGGLLRRIGDRGLLVIKDVTSILAMHRDTRGALLAALREIHDGRWERNVGVDGGRSLKWTGRLVVIGAVTTVWDRAHDVISAMGDRFVLVRMDSNKGRHAAGRRACRNVGDEVQMRSELAAVVGGVLATVTPQATIQLTEPEEDRLLRAADVVTLARTGVDYDYRGDVVDAHAPEMPTRFVKQLKQIVRGAVAIGLDRTAAVQLAIRCARDSMPPLRLAIVDDIAAHPGSQTRDVRRRLDKPRATIDRQLQALHMLGVLLCDEEETTHRGEAVTRWRYRLAPGIDPDVLDPDSVPEKSVPIHMDIKRERDKKEHTVVTDISGTESCITPVDCGDPRTARTVSNELRPGAPANGTTPAASAPD